MPPNERRVRGRSWKSAAILRHAIFLRAPHAEHSIGGRSGCGKCDGVGSGGDVCGCGRSGCGTCGGVRSGSDERGGGHCGRGGGGKGGGGDGRIVHAIY